MRTTENLSSWANAELAQLDRVTLEQLDGKIMGLVHGMAHKFGAAPDDTVGDIVRRAGEAGDEVALILSQHRRDYFNSQPESPKGERNEPERPRGSPR